MISKKCILTVMGNRRQNILFFVVTLWSFLCWTSVLSRPKNNDFGINNCMNNCTKAETIHSNQIEQKNLTVKECQCTEPDLCDFFMIDERSLDGFSSPVCENYIKECCTSEEQSNDFSQRFDLSTQRSSTCGIRIEGGLELKIAQGNDSEFGEFPWMVMVIKETSQEFFSYQCGGSLIHPQVVLTAAHCVMHENITQLRVRGGKWNTEYSDERVPSQDRKIAKIISNNFNRGSGYNDIVLLVLEEAFAKFDNIDVICLPRQGDVVVGDDCIATGWGLNSHNEKGTYQKTLKKVTLSIVPRGECEKYLKNNRPDYVLDESIICAKGVSGADTCKGDGGSPLICPVKNGGAMQYQQVGIVSWGDGCGTNTPGMYANVAHFVNWIDEQFNQLGFHQIYYY